MTIMIQSMLMLLGLGPALAFTPFTTRHPSQSLVVIQRPHSFLASSTSPTDATTTDVAKLSVREIKAELDQLKVSYVDCFDKESLVQRLRQALEKSTVGEDVQEGGDGQDPPSPSTTEATTTQSPDSRTPTVEETEQSTTTSNNQPPMSSSSYDDDAELLQEIRSLRVRELREELAKRNLRWAGFVEKEDLVRAVYQARIKARDFSITGLMAPGEVADLTGEQLELELQSQEERAPLLLDAYATWCGPCQMMAPQLAEAAKEWGDSVRVAKMDTDQHPAQASKFQVQGLPTLILFQNNGKELARIEGALMKDQLLQWVAAQLPGE